MNETVQKYKIEIEVREDGFVNYSLFYFDENNKAVEISGSGSSLPFVLETIGIHVRSGKAREE